MNVAQAVSQAISTGTIDQGTLNSIEASATANDTRALRVLYDAIQSSQITVS
ncbi:MAG: hypothetical protein AAFV85_26775 [Cyanobacteria bacterium J06634_6]